MNHLENEILEEDDIKDEEDDIKDEDVTDRFDISRDEFPSNLDLEIKSGKLSFCKIVKLSNYLEKEGFASEANFIRKLAYTG